jgi:hypothetical protein
MVYLHVRESMLTISSLIVIQFERFGYAFCHLSLTERPLERIILAAVIKIGLGGGPKAML